MFFKILKLHNEVEIIIEFPRFDVDNFIPMIMEKKQFVIFTTLAYFLRKDKSIVYVVSLFCVRLNIYPVVS